MRDCPDKEDGYMGFSAAFFFNDETRDALYVYAEEGGNVNHVGHLVRKYLEKFHPDRVWTLTWAETCDKMRPGEFSGGFMVVTAKEVYIRCAVEDAQEWIRNHTSGKYLGEV
jgi:hypothetical protein